MQNCVDEYVRLKLIGALDNKKLFIEEYEDYNPKESIVSYMKKYICNNSEEYENIVKEYKPLIDEVKKKSNTKKTQDSWKFDSMIKFYEFYQQLERKCCYCGIEEKQLTEYFNKTTIQSDSAKRKRGKVLELERVVTAPAEKNVYNKENCFLACYICNNAKSDFLSVKSFKPIAKGINQFWNETVKDKVNFPEESKVWEKK